jgi:hypothetical protein
MAPAMGGSAMQGLRFLRASAAAAVLVVGALAGSLLSSGPASATAKTVICTSLTGNLTDTPVTFVLSGCSGNTGGHGSAQDNTITWGNGRTTYLAVSAFPLPPGTAKRGDCPDLSDRYAISDTVAGDSTGSIKVGGKASAAVCILNESPDPWTLAPGSDFKLR